MPEIFSTVHGTIGHVCLPSCLSMAFVRSICQLNNGNIRPPVLCAGEAPDEKPKKSTNWALHRIECDGACCAAETIEHKEHRVSKPRTKR